MIEQNKINQIKKLISDGFDIESISLELAIPLKEIEQYKLEIENAQKSNSLKTYNARELIDNKNKQIHSQIQEMRKKYEKLFFTTNKVAVKPIKELSEQNPQKIDSIIVEVEEMMKGFKELSREEKRKRARGIIKLLEIVEDCPLTIEQAERLYLFLHLEELQKLNYNTIGEAIDASIREKEKAIIKSLAEAIDSAQSQTDDLKELQKLEKKITTEMLQKRYLSIGAVKSRIENKISKINQQKAIDKIRNAVPEEIKLMVKELAKGTLEIQKANETIAKEAKKRMENKPKNRFSLTEEQERRQILIQIRTMLAEKPEQYPISYPEKTVKQLQELCGGEIEQCIRAVVQNLINKKEFKKAKEIYNKFFDSNKQGASSTAKNLRQQIQNAEIGDFIWRAINTNGMEKDEERRYFESIEEGLKSGDVKLGTITIGKSQDGCRTITLADIWGDEDQKMR